MQSWWQSCAAWVSNAAGGQGRALGGKLLSGSFLCVSFLAGVYVVIYLFSASSGDFDLL